MTEIPSCILSQYMWYNVVQIKPLFNFYGFSKKKIHYVSQLFNSNGSIKNGMNLRENTIYKRIIIFNE